MSAMCEGNIVITVETSNSRSEKVIQGSADLLANDLRTNHFRATHGHGS
jgi:hypothetical protein